jgi:glyoxylase-like metal-dependent hydrolase (beta-lactamase superfamily II)
MTINYDVLVTLPRTVQPDDSSGQAAPTWSPIAATLIYGERDAVLVDVPFTTEQAREVANWISASGRNLVAMYSTHGHLDHWVGFAEIAKRFPNAQVLATAGTVTQIAKTAGQLEFLHHQFPGQIPAELVEPHVIDSYTFDLEGHEIRFVEAGNTDTVDTTYVHIPDLSLVLGGDVIYNGVHPYLAETDARQRQDWIAALNKIAALNPTTVVAGHKAPGSDNDPRQIAETLQYLLDAEEAYGIANNAKEFTDLMMLKHHERINHGVLTLSAEALFPGTTVA